MDTNENNTLKVTQVKVFPFKEGLNIGRIKAIAEFVLNGQLLLRGVCVMDGENGISLDYLGEDIVAFLPMTREFREEIEAAVLNEYIRTLCKS